MIYIYMIYIYIYNLRVKDIGWAADTLLSTLEGLESLHFVLYLLAHFLNVGSRWYALSIFPASSFSFSISSSSCVFHSMMKGTSFSCRTTTSGLEVVGTHRFQSKLMDSRLSPWVSAYPCHLPLCIHSCIPEDLIWQFEAPASEAKNNSFTDTKPASKFI